MWPFGKNAKGRLEDALKDHELTKPLDLRVEVKDKTAKVTGEVPNDRYPNLVSAIATGINGIDKVDVTGLRVAAGAPATAGGTARSGGMGSAQAGSASAASALDAPSGRAKAAHASIKAEPTLANNPLDVLQKGTTVVLRGAVDNDAEFQKAKALALAVPGVTAVDTSGLQVIKDAALLNVTDADGDVIYTVKSGDTLSHIALHYYGSAGRSSYMKIAEANGISDPNKIRVGQVLKIPGTTKGPGEVLA